MSAEIQSDGKTVWVNGADGCCIGRFSRFGIDIHRDFAAQLAGLGQCLDCTHTMPDLSDWKRFVSAMRCHYDVEIGARYMPEFLK